VRSMWSTSSTAHDGDDDWTMASALEMWQSVWRTPHIDLDTRLPRREDRHARHTLRCDHPTRAGARGPGLDLAEPARHAMDENWDLPDTLSRMFAFVPPDTLRRALIPRLRRRLQPPMCRRGPPARKDRGQALSRRAWECDCQSSHASRFALYLDHFPLSLLVPLSRAPSPNIPPPAGCTARCVSSCSRAYCDVYIQWKVLYD
jgi:hypothetical protein